jgi:hypothetical protein
MPGINNPSLLKACLVFSVFFSETRGFQPQVPVLPSTTRLHSVADTGSKAPPRTGFGQTVLNFALASPLWKHVLVPQARATMVKTAEANGIPWDDAKNWLETNCEMTTIDEYSVPEYYKRAFHAYEEGNLSWKAALEVEIASCSVGARNFPQYGSKVRRARVSFFLAVCGALFEAHLGSFLYMYSSSGLFLYTIDFVLLGLC